MEFFLPSLIILILSGIVSFVIIPKISPIIILILSFALLAFGMYHHYKLFADEYRLSTWQEQIRFYAPGVAIGSLVLFILIFVLSLFKHAEVPVPNIPSISPVTTTNTFTAPVASALNTVTAAANNMMSNTTRAVSGAVNTIKNTANMVIGNAQNGRNAINKNIGSSFFSKV